MPAPSVKSRPLPQQVRAREAYNKVPTKGKDDDPGRYTKTPHDYGDLLISGGKLGGALQRDLLHWIMRHTWGTNTSRKPNVIIRPEYAKLSIGALSKLCQVWDEDKEKLRPVQPKSVAVALADLEARGIIQARERKGCGKTTAKMYKLTPERWKAAPPYKPPTPKELEAAEIAAAAEEEAETPEAEATAELESTVQPGKVSRPQAVAVNVKDAPAVTIRMVYRSEGFDVPVTFRSRTGRNGRLQITATPHRHSEEGRNYGCAPLQSFAKRSPSNSLQTEENKRFNDYKAYITEFVSQFWAIEADEALINEVFARAGSAPLTHFSHRVNLKLRNARRDPRNKPALLKNLADDAQEDWKKETARSEAQAARHAVSNAPVMDSDPPTDERPWWEGTGYDRRVK